MNARKKHKREIRPTGSNDAPADERAGESDAVDTDGVQRETADEELAAGRGDETVADERATGRGDEMEALRAELDEANHKWLRTLADLENHRKRVVRERARWDIESREGVLLPLLEVVDNFERALAEEVPEELGDGGPFREGVELIFKHLMNVLEKSGVRPIETEGVGFDPNVHEAVGSTPSDEHESDEIVQEMQKGYMLGERLLRPARVIVAS
ncbi:nucleotide exchange factor GrpE [bacterium]|nr:nucleotide exchange factor GrpE [bacterium]